MIKISNKWLHIFYSLVYLKICIFFAYIHLLKHLDDYTQILNAVNLDTSELDDLASVRGLRKEDDNQSAVELISSSGVVVKTELSDVNRSINNQIDKVFNTAGEFLESVEDSRDSIWLVHIVINNSDQIESPHECGKSKYMNTSDWVRLTRQLAKFGILTGRFNCESDPYFCQERGWTQPQLVLGMIKHTKLKPSRELVEFYYYNDCRLNSNDLVLKWIEIMLRNRLLMSYDFELYPYQKKIFDEQDKLKLKIYYHNNASINQIPLYYSAMSVKYHKRAKFYYLNNKTGLPNDLCKNETPPNTPIYLIVDNRLCYNYGANLNELPNYAHLSLFLVFLYPDMNNIFLFSFFLLNSFLFMFFFEYNISILKQIGRGLFYLCIFNFILFSIWLFTLNSTKFNSLFNNLFYQVRYLILFNSSTQTFFAHLRFVHFYYIYVKPLNALIFYLIAAFLYYIHTKLNHFNSKRSYPLVRVSIKTNFISPIQLERTSSDHSRQTQIDMEISVSELINQINGLTTIWLQSSSLADRLIDELPTIEYCVCFYANSVRKKTYDETDCGESETTEDEDLLKSEKTRLKRMKCECGRNAELSKYFGENELATFWEKFSRECSICLSKYKYNCLIVHMPCGHNFHRHCIYEWFMSSMNYKMSCPICRAFFNFKKTI